MRIDERKLIKKENVHAKERTWAREREKDNEEGARKRETGRLFFVFLLMSTM